MRALSRNYVCFAVWMITALLLGIAPLARAQVTLKFTSAYTCDINGNAATLYVGGEYGIRANWTVTGTPKANYSVRFKMANQTWDLTGTAVRAGSFWGWAHWPLPLDGPIPYTIILDPNHTSGDPTIANHNTYNGTFTPTPPSNPVEYYGTTTRQASETFTVNWSTDARIISGFTVMGYPTTDTFQTISNLTGTSGATQYVTQPTGDPAWLNRYTNYSANANSHTWVNTANFAVTVSNVRVNPDMLRRGSWSALGILSPDLVQWIYPDTLIQSNDPSITQFVKQTLPANYRTSMTLYDAARTLYLAVVRRTAYATNLNFTDAVNVLKNGKGDCIGFSALFAACLRNIGIPARCIDGFWKGQNQYYGMMEFFVPNNGWVQADGAACRNYWDATGTYAYLFGAQPRLNQFCAVSRGDNHQVLGQAINSLQFGWFYYTSTAGNYTFSDSCSLN